MAPLQVTDNNTKTVQFSGAFTAPDYHCQVFALPVGANAAAAAATAAAVVSAAAVVDVESAAVRILMQPVHRAKPCPKGLQMFCSARFLALPGFEEQKEC